MRTGRCIEDILQRSHIGPEMLLLLGMKQGKSPGYTCLPTQV